MGSTCEMLRLPLRLLWIGLRYLILYDAHDERLQKVAPNIFHDLVILDPHPCLVALLVLMNSHAHPASVQLVRSPPVLEGPPPWLDRC